ncbi:MAG TPA: SCO family protein [Candidatus Poseidoniaceae archaeon]|nr:SCO family protein [Candidatus Poseidoniaceae archaeon]
MNKNLFVLILVSMTVSAGCLSPSEIDIFLGEDINSVETFRPFVLQDNNDTMFNSSILEGNVTIFGFIYVNCPDVCPTTTSDMKWIESQLTEIERSRVHFVSITVDPWRDGPLGLSQYMEDYNVSWPHLTTRVDTEDSLSLIEDVWTDFSIGVILTEANSSTSLARGHTVYYDIEHTNGVVLVDSYGNLRVRWNHENWNPEGILVDLRSMVN